MILALDAGTSRVKAALFDGNEIVLFAAKKTACVTTPALLEELALDLAGHDITLPLQVIASVSRPDLVDVVQDAFGSQGHFKLAFASAAMAESIGMPIRYDPPESLGADRIADALGGRTIYGSPVIVVDLGTATTFNVVGADGGFLGGAIAPGYGAFSNWLAERAPHLPVAGEPLPHVLGTNSKDAVTAGTVLGYAAMIDGMIGRLAAEAALDRYTAVCTGGHCEGAVSRACTLITERRSHLTLIGLQVMGERLLNG